VRNNPKAGQLGVALHKLLDTAATLERELGIRVDVFKPDPIYTLVLEGGLQVTTYAVVLYVSVESGKEERIEA